MSRSFVAACVAASTLATTASGTAICQVTKTLGCYIDDGDADRVLGPGNPGGDGGLSSNSLENCAAACFDAGFTAADSVFGVEFGVQCFCGRLNSSAGSAPAAQCAKRKCPGSVPLPGEDPEYCGDNNRLLAFQATCTAQPALPNFMPCGPLSPGKDLPFCDSSLPTADRIADMLGRMSLQQKCAQTNDKMGPMPEIGWQGYNWNTECLHGLGAVCLTKGNQTRCPSIFAAPPALGATFNLSVAAQLGETISDEIRAYGNTNGHRSYQSRPIGVSAWGPNLNIYRDARWGRNVEVPSEDPFHSGSYGVAYTRGLQFGADPNYTKAIGALKHYTMYSVEQGRGSTYFEISSYDVEDTYLPQFKTSVMQGGSLGYMCSYAALTNAELIPDSGEAGHPHSEPLCASRFFAQQKMRDEYGFKGYVQSDCGAVNNEDGGEHWAANKTDAAARALSGGLMNSNCGGGLVGSVCAAIGEGLTTEDELDQRVRRSLRLLMEAGLFDPLDKQTYTQIPFETINSEQAQRRNREAAEQGLVLLKNPPLAGGGGGTGGGTGGTSGATGGYTGSASVLPLSKGLGAGAVLLLGPHARTQKTLAGNYFEDIGLGVCAGPGCVPTVEASLNRANGAGGNKSVTVLEGCKDMKCGSLDVAAVTAAASSAAVQVVVMAMGVDSSIAGEGRDRMDIRLPGKQAALVQAAIAATRMRPQVRLVLLLFNGGTIALEDLALEPRLAIVECWFPGATGAAAIADTLFGDRNRFGKLPFTYYHHNYTELSDFTNMNMTESKTQPGRTYKYMTDQSLAAWPFGYGLSYTSFAFSNATLQAAVLPPAGSSGGSAAAAAAAAAAATVTVDAPAWAGAALRHFRAPAAARRALDARLQSETVATASVTVTNTGPVAGDEVAFLFHKPAAVTLQWGGPFAAAPLKQLVAYQRVSLAPGASQTVSFPLTAQQLSTVDARGTRHLLPGAHGLTLSRGHGAELDLALQLTIGAAAADAGARRVVISSMIQEATAHLHGDEL
jgi:beta-glucosidase-like glycosyl hydrolase